MSKLLWCIQVIQAPDCKLELSILLFFVATGMIYIMFDNMCCRSCLLGVGYANLDKSKISYFITFGTRAFDIQNCKITIYFNISVCILDLSGTQC